MPRIKPLTTEDPLIVLIAVDIGALRQASGMTCADIAKACGMSQSTVAARLRDPSGIRLSELIKMRNVMRARARARGYDVPDVMLDGRDGAALRGMIKEGKS